VTYDSQLPLVLDLAGVFTAACSGTFVGLRKGLDVVGILVVAAVTGLGGGVIRDLAIGAIPPLGFSDWRYEADAFGAAAIVLLVEYVGPRPRLRELVRRRATEAAQRALLNATRVADAATLGLFTVVGTTKALAFHITPLPAALLGVITAVGGGVLRDVLTNEVPYVLRRELYAVPAFLGGIVVVVAYHYGILTAPVKVAAVVLVIAVRMVAVLRDWHAPRPGTVTPPPPAASA
jgi:uncharacterized membrane protein YeiH